jgi:hypothetical protein
VLSGLLLNLLRFGRGGDISPIRSSQSPLVILTGILEDAGGFMFCPTCRSEYRKGFSECADCHVELIPELAPLPAEPKSSDFVEYQELLSTYNLADIAFIESILDSEKIIYFMQNEEFNTLTFSPQPVRVMVNTDQFDQAKKLLKDFQPQYSRLSSD